MAVSVSMSVNNGSISNLIKIQQSLCCSILGCATSLIGQSGKISDLWSYASCAGCAGSNPFKHA
jgi:hypothetical protein